MDTYQTTEGTQPHAHVGHEPRTVERRGEDLMMMTEIGDGVFVQWGTCRRCSERVGSCQCKGGPVEPPHMKDWRDQRFERELGTRPDPDFDLLPSVVEWVKERGYQVIRPGATAALMSAAQEAQDAAYGDSNDSEIDLLRDALEQALALLGERLPEGNDPDDDEEPSTVQVRFQPQAWVNDNAMDVDAEGPVTWFVSEETAAEIPDSNDLDFVRGDEFAYQWIKDWSGPFEITVVHDSAEAMFEHLDSLPEQTEGEDYGDGDSDRLKGRDFDAGF